MTPVRLKLAAPRSLVKHFTHMSKYSHVSKTIWGSGLNLISALKRKMSGIHCSVEQFDPIKSNPTFCWPDLGSNCLQRFSAGAEMLSVANIRFDP